MNFQTLRNILPQELALRVLEYTGRSYEHEKRCVLNELEEYFNPTDEDNMCGACMGGFNQENEYGLCQCYCSNCYCEMSDCRYTCYH